jgi:glycosyltransferase involved in cell wall biosynthesis
VLLEAAACGTPFVASRVGGIPEIAHLAPSRLVPPGEATTLAEAIAERINRPLCTPAEPSAAALRSHPQAAAELAVFFEQTIQVFRSSHAQECRRLTAAELRH